MSFEMSTPTSAYGHSAPGQPVEAEICFRTPTTTRFVDRAFAFVLGGGVGLMGTILAISFALLASDVGAPVVVVVFLALGAIFLAWWFAWRITAHRLRFVVAFHMEFLQIGEGSLRCRFPYEQIDEVRVPRRGEHGSWIKVRCGWKSTRVVLQREDVARCWYLLARVCPNAIVVDDEGKEHWSASAGDTARMLLSCERQQKRKAVALAWCALAVLPIGGIRSWLAIQWLAGNLGGGIDKALGLFVTGPFFLFGAVVLLAQATRAFRNSRDARRNRLAMTNDEERLLPVSGSDGDFNLRGS